MKSGIDYDATLFPVERYVGGNLCNDPQENNAWVTESLLAKADFQRDSLGAPKAVLSLNMRISGRYGGVVGSPRQPFRVCQDCSMRKATARPSG